MSGMSRGEGDNSLRHSDICKKDLLRCIEDYSLSPLADNIHFSLPVDKWAHLTSVPVKSDKMMFFPENSPLLCARTHVSIVSISVKSGGHFQY